MKFCDIPFAIDAGGHVERAGNVHDCEFVVTIAAEESLSRP